MTDLSTLLHDAALSCGVDPATPGWMPHENPAQAFYLADHLRMMIDITDDRVSLTVFHGAHMETLRAQFRPGRERTAVILYAITRLAARVGGVQ